MALRSRPTVDDIRLEAELAKVDMTEAQERLLRRWRLACIDDMKISMTESAGTPSNTRAVLRDVLDLLMEMAR